MANRHLPLKIRFESSFIRNHASGCWLWRGVASNKYGMIRVSGHKTKAHRVSYEMFIGPIAVGLCVCHKCDTPSCVNPDHLFLGTQSENMRDGYRKGRIKLPIVNSAQRARGERHGRARLSAEQVSSIRNDERSNKEIANEYGMSAANIWRIKSRLLWKHVT